MGARNSRNFGNTIGSGNYYKETPDLRNHIENSENTVSKSGGIRSAHNKKIFKRL